MNPDKFRLWQALGMGPIWRERAVGDTADAVTVVTGHGSAVPDAAAREAPSHRPQGRGAGPAELPPLDWGELEAAVAACTACGLCQSRTQTVFGVGQHTAHWLFVGEAPGAEEDARGEPFVGQAGRLLDNMLSAAGLARGGAGPEGVYIANTLKCRPPGNRNPELPEITACAPFLQRQIALLQPRIIVVMGRFAAQALLGTDASIASLRGRAHELDMVRANGKAARVPVVVTYHPAYLLRSLADKAKAWDDLCLARDTYSLARAG